MSQQIYQLILLLICLVVSHGSVSHSLQEQDQSLNTDFGFALDQFQGNLSQHTKYGGISQSLIQVGLFSDESLRKFREVSRIKDAIKDTLISSLDNNPTSKEEILEKQVNDFEKTYEEMRGFYQKFKQEIQNTPWNQLTEGLGTKFQELEKQIKLLRDEEGSCLDEDMKLVAEHEKLDKQNQASNRKIEELQKSIQLKEASIQKNLALINDLDKKSQEESANLNEKQANDLAKLIDQNRAQLNSNEQRLREIEERLVHLDTAAAELRAAENQDPGTLQGIEEEMNRLTDEKKNLIQVNSDIIKVLEELIAQNAQPSQDESITKKERLKLLQDLEDQKIILFKENERIQSEISALRSEIEKIPTFTAQLEVLGQRRDLKDQECKIKQDNINQKIQDRDLLLNDENLQGGALTEIELIKEKDKVLDLKKNFVASMEFALNRFKNEHSELKNYLQQSNFKRINESIWGAPDIYLPKLYDSDSCEEGVDCLKDIFSDILPEIVSGSRAPLATHLAVLFTRINSVDFLLKDENNELLKVLKHLMKSRLVTLKKAGWSLTSIAQSLIDFLLDTNPTLFIKITEEELENEMTKMEEILIFIRNQVRRDFEKLILRVWKEKVRERIQKISPTDMSTGDSLTPPLSEEKQLISHDL